MQNKLLAVITGASKGIGLSLAKKFMQENYEIIAISRTKPPLEGVIWIKADITSSQDRLNIKKQIEKSHNKIDLLINNAGIGMYNKWENSPIEDIKKIFDINFFALIEITQILLPFLKKTKGTIVNTSSVAGKFHVACMGAYCATKHALNAFSNSLRIEVKPYDISVVNLIVGRINTGFSSSALGDIKPPSTPGAGNADILANKVFKAVIHKKREITFPFWYHFFIIFIKLFPRIYDFFNLKKWKLSK